ncbi:hypothetical protein KP509_12G006700 [Ceratopteris richardii]|uniref:Uncharacterized protein n=1 Tax=Ceratopteris richardii TaxID=49495 RepID=A0A8T2TLR7_CERRI|nr:hypothetical protein KP509_12G006700 [Ceratopteris richardii]
MDEKLSPIRNHNGCGQSSSPPSSSPPSSPSEDSGFRSTSVLKVASVRHQVLKVRLEEELLVKLALGEAETRLSLGSIASLLGPSPLGPH